VGSSGQESFTYDEGYDDNHSYDENGQFTNGAVTYTSTYVGAYSQGASWDDDGNQDRFTPDNAGQLDELTDQYGYHAAFQESYTLDAASTDATYTVTVHGGGSASSTAADQGTATFAAATTLDGEPGTQSGNETFSGHNSGTADTTTDQAITIQDGSWTFTNLDQTDTFHLAEDFTDQGGVTVTAGDAASDTVGDND
jgi:hypothetical protein